MKKEVSFQLEGKEVKLESGFLAKQADGAVRASVGDNQVLVTVVSSRQEVENDFFPLSVEYSERLYSIGQIPGGYFRREGRPTSEAILNCRLIDRHLRPCFPETYQSETQVVATILSYDGTYSLTSLSSIAASAALHLSDIPFDGPTCAFQLIQTEKGFSLNPSYKELSDSKMSLFVAGTKDGIVMVEGEAAEASEEELLEALKKTHENMQVVFKAQEELRQKMGEVPKREVKEKKRNLEFYEKVKKDLVNPVKESFKVKEKRQRTLCFLKLKKDKAEFYLKDLKEEDKALCEKEFKQAFEDTKYEVARDQIAKDKTRIDGRKFDEIRPIACEVGLLKRTHGSSVFTRGETQVLATVTLGSEDDEQFVESLDGLQKKKFLLHYNFPPYCVGETGRLGGQSRREIGHGFLAERGLKAVLPEREKFPYTLRIVSEVLESNGSSSMGTVCSGMLALLDAGVPVKDNVAGIAMGLVQKENEFFILSDILGDEDHLGDMDFKVVGSKKGITAVQMDIKVKSLSFDVLKKALNQAKDGRLHILNKMEEVLKDPRENLSSYAPRVEVLHINKDKIKELIGPGGKMIKSIVEETKAKVSVEDSGKVSIVSSDPEARKMALKRVKDICQEVEEGKVYKGVVTGIKEFGAFVEVLPRQTGLLHISEIDKKRIKRVEDVLKEGDKIEVKVLSVDRQGRVRLSRKALL